MKNEATITLCECSCGEQTKNGNRFLVGHSGNKKGGPNFVKGHQVARKVPVGELPLSHRPDYRRDYAKDYRARNKEKIKTSQVRSRLMALFRVTPEELEGITKYQAGHNVFKILLGSHMGTDHDHRTGLIRGRLDFRFNRALGLIEQASPCNAPEVLRALAEFLEHPPATTALGAPRYGLIGKAQYKKKMVYGPIAPKELKKEYK